MKGFIAYVITDGQDLVDEPQYAKLPTSLQETNKRLVDQVQ